MMNFSYPKSFPNPDEEKFLRLVLSTENDFQAMWNEWSGKIIFDDLDPAIVRLLPLLSMRLNKSKIDGALVKRIHGVYKYAWFKNQQLFKTLKDVLVECDKNNIPVVLLKGASLLISVYKDMGARTLGDCDILIHPENALKLFELLQSFGCNPVDKTIADIKRFGLDKVTHATTFINQNNVHLEVHWHVYHLNNNESALRYLFLKDIESHQLTEYFWKYSVPVSVYDTKCKMLSSEDLFVHVISHGAEGNKRRPLRWVVDSSWILDSQKLDWNRVLESAKRTEHVFDMQIAIKYLVEKFGLTFPVSFVEELNNVIIDKNISNKYYKMSDIHYSLLGKFPSLWYRYWLYESSGSVFDRIYAFPKYLHTAWDIPKNKNLFSFVFSKYTERILRLFSSV